ncbi:MAG: hypothetical protein AAGH83_07180 [Pseudomonadota bacterium]
MSAIWDTTALAEAGVSPTDPPVDAATLRANVFEMTQAAEEAVLAPSDCGSWPPDLRAALAARIARLNAAEQVAARYAARMVGPDYETIADPGIDGAAQGLEAVIAFMDKVATQTRDVNADDIGGLQRAGVSDADIVRLCELNAFLAYQLRLIAGLQLLAGESP